MTESSLAVRRYQRSDEPAVLDLLSASLGWVPDDQYAGFFRWKHYENPFGESPAWVALDDERIVGFRIFLRWQFLRDGLVVPAVRAVDTATHPEYQGRGIFKLLTLAALNELRDEGIGFVFNTPNDNSRPGYLKMGWKLVGVPALRFRPRSPLAMVRVATARVAADKWSQVTSAGVAARDASLSEAPQPRPSPGQLTTNRTEQYFAWRYGFAPLEYRVSVAPLGIGTGAVVYRVRRRGRAREVAISEMLVDAATTARQLQRSVLRETGADYAVRIANRTTVGGDLPLPGQGPTLVWRDVVETSMPAMPSWNLALGDIELF